MKHDPSLTGDIARLSAATLAYDEAADCLAHRAVNAQTPIARTEPDLLWNKTHQEARYMLARCAGIFKSLAGDRGEGSMRDFLLREEAEIDAYLNSTRGGSEPNKPLPVNK